MERNFSTNILSKENVFSFEKDGFEYHKEIFQNDVTDRVLEFLNQALEVELNHLKKYFNKFSYQEIVFEINSMNDATFNSLSEELKQRISGHFSLDTRLSNILWEIPKDEKFQLIIKKILKTDKLYMHMPPVARFILPNNLRAGVPPHQDISYNQHMTDFLTVWVPFVKIDDLCGGVNLYSGSQNHNVLNVSKKVGSYWNQEIPIFDYPEVSFSMNKGDFLTFGKTLIHSSRGNSSNYVRISIDYRFFGENSYSKKHYLDLQSLKVISPL
jgi:hypothetical protein